MSGAEPSTRERWRRVSDTLDRALARPPEQWPELLDGACRGDPGLRAEVEELLAVDPVLLAELDRPLVELGAAGPPSWPQVPGYQLLAELGRGGMGEVYRALASSEGGEVAIKVLKRGLDTDEILTRFRIERQILSSLEHPHIVRLLDGGSTADGRPFLVMELVEGERIDRWAERLGLGLAARLELFLKVCSAVTRAHRSLVVHRDLKPGNILVDVHGEPKLIDFGVAKLLDASSFDPSTATRLSEAPMTWCYASPEQSLGEPVTTASDLYSLGVVLYELLTGESPYGKARSDLIELRRAVAQGAVVPAGRISKALAGDLEAILDKTLARQPEHRYRSVEHLAEDLRRYLTGLPVEARPLPLAQRIGRWARRQAGLAAALGIVLLLLLGSVLERSLAHRRLAAELDEARKLARFLSLVIVPTGAPADRREGVSARRLLDDGMAKVDAELAGEPLLQATALMSIASGYQGMALFNEAEAAIARAHQVRRQLLGAEHPLTVDCIEARVNVAVARGHQAEAERLVLEVLALRQRVWGPDDPRLLNARVSIVALKLDNGHYLEAAEGFRAILDGLLALNPRPIRSIAALRGNLALTLFLADQLPEAETAARTALAESQQSLPPGHGQIQAHQATLAKVLAAQGDLAPAVELIEQALEAVESSAGWRHPAVAARLALKAEMMLAAGDLDQARQLASRAVETWRDLASGDLHPDASSALLILAKVERHSGNGEAASQLAVETVELRQRRLRAGHPALAEALLELARSELAVGRGTASSRHRDSAREILAAAGLEHHRWWRKQGSGLLPEY